MRNLLPVVPVVFLLSLGAAAQSTTFVVDDGGGPGVSFTDLPQAVSAAVDGDLILVRPGNYSAFALGKALTIVADDGARVARGASIANVSTGGGARISGLDFTDLVISGCTVPVLFDRTDVLGTLSTLSAYPALTIDACTDVRIQGGTVRGKNGPTHGDWGAHAARVINSRVEFSSSSLIGGNGRNHNLTLGSTDGGNGGDGLWCENGSRVHVARASVSGGSGGDGCFALCSGTGGDGGHAIWIDGSSTAILAGSSSQVIAGGVAGTGMADGVPGYGVLDYGGLRYSGVTIQSGDSWYPPINAIAGSSVTLASPPDPTLELIGVPTAGALVTFRLHGTAGSFARLQQGNVPLVVDDGLVEIEKLNNRIRLHPLGAMTSNSIDYFANTPSSASPGWFRVFQGLEIDGSTGDLLQRTNSILVIAR